MKHADVLLKIAVAAARRVNQKQFGTSAFPFWLSRRHTATTVWTTSPTVRTYQPTIEPFWDTTHDQAKLE